MLKERLRQALIDQAQTGNLMTYKELGGCLGLEPPQTIHLIGKALETLMEDDVAAARPMLAAPCVSKMRPGVLACGFSLAAQVLGGFSGYPTGPEARAFHAITAACAFILWKPASGSGASCFVKKATEIRGIQQVQQETMSFFARLKTEAAHLHRAPVPTLPILPGS